ncbi:MAG: dockerin type I domain-containing protein [Defluviitaleaceae bacterium]|nr:dockerin type I domain-containing protein [Defluviitaleaceae bacterium]MCL2262927.1 dockerin type I domain-containing protein [Defluviitaleaceae bacterium]
MKGKKFAVKLMVAVFFVLVMSVFAAAEGKPMTGVIGDADGDGRLTSADATFIARYVTGQFENIPNHKTHTDEWRRIADTNCDGFVSAASVTRLARMLAGHFETLCPRGGCLRCDPTHGKHRFPGGSGTAEDPYHVSTPQDLNAVRFNLYAHYIQINDIDMYFDTRNPNGLFYNNGAGWEPIGTFESDINWFDYVFRGVYDGGGFEIIGLNINRTSSRQHLLVGLFSFIREGTVKNLGMVDGSIKGTSTGGAYSNVIAGSISGFLRGGTLTNSFNTGTVIAVNEPYVGSDAHAGGLIGYVRYSIISDSHNTGDISAITGIGSFAFAGGISGWTIADDPNNASHISNCFNTGAIYASNPARISHAGGITGLMRFGSITNCHNKGDIESFTATGGIVGFASVITIINNSNAGNVSGGLAHNVGEIYGTFREQ